MTNTNELEEQLNEKKGFLEEVSIRIGKIHEKLREKFEISG